MHNSKEIVNLQDLFVLIVGYVDNATYSLTTYYYIIERDFIYRFLILLISIFSFLLGFFTVSWWYERDYLHLNIDILLYIMFCIINTITEEVSEKSGLKK